MNLSYGSRGDDVKKLQESLNKQGYSLSVDGIFGSQTQQAVQDYQRKNSLAVDGIAGTNTQNSLYNTKSSGEQSQKPQEEVKPPSYSYNPSENKAYQDALQNLQNAQGAEVPQYNGTYDKQMTDIYNQIMNRKPFSYDLGSDPLYSMYADQYTQKGRMAMMDTMGQTAALTGGYGNSYAQSVGQQQYDAYLQRLNEVVPELYANAREQYDKEGSDLLQQYSMAADMRNDEYSRYQDDYSRYLDTLQRAQSEEEKQYDRGYQDWINSQEMAYDRQQDAYERALNTITTLGYLPSDAELAAAGMSKEEAQQWLQYYQKQQMPVYSGGGGGGKTSGYEGPTTPTVETEWEKSLKKVAEKEGVKIEDVTDEVVTDWINSGRYSFGSTAEGDRILRTSHTQRDKPWLYYQFAT